MVKSQQDVQTDFYEDINKKLNLATPNASSFEEYTFNKLNHYSGSTGNSIPIYEINSGRIKYPINLNYFLGGIKVNTSSSDVGLGWSLSGAYITRTINDILDTDESIYERDTQQYINFDYQNGPVGMWFTPLLNSQDKPGYIGYQTRKLYNKKQSQYYKVDKFPDMFNVSLPDDKLNFYFPDNFSNAVKLTNNNSKITPYVGYKPLVYSMYQGLNVGRGVKEFLKFDITDNKGIIYTFEKVDYSQNIAFQYNASSDNPNCSQNSTPTNYADIVKTEADSWNHPKAVVWYITKIKDPSSNEEINFEYETYTTESSHNTSFTTLLNNNRPYYRSESRIYKSSYSQNDLSCKLPKNGYCQRSPVVRTYVRLIEGNRLKKITFRSGSVSFEYNHNRQDFTNGKAITAIKVKNTFDKVTKQFNFNYSYFNSLPYRNEFSKRLKLVSVEEVGKPLYTFEYFENNNLPQIGSFNQDVFGYSNTSEDIDHPEVSNPNRAKYYFYPNQKEYSLLPYNITGLQKFDLGGVIDKQPNEYAKTWSLKKINYPTGGYKSYELETNTFQLFGQTLNGSGIRVKSQTIFDPLNSNAPMRTINYNYNNDNGQSSGLLHNVPFVGYPLKKFYESSYGGVNGDDESIIVSDASVFSGLTNLHTYFFLDTNPNINSGLIETNSIGYSKVDEIEGTHKTQYQFINEESKNELKRRYKRPAGVSPYTDYFTGYGMSTSCMSMWLHINSGLGSIEGTLNKDFARGVPKEINYFNANTLLKKEKFEYINYFNKDTAPSQISGQHFYYNKIDDADFTSTQNTTYDNVEVMYFDKIFLTQNNYLKKHEVIDYAANGQTGSVEKYNYLNNATGKNPNLTEVITEYSSGDAVNNTYEYASDQMSNLINANMLGIPLKSIRSKNSVTERSKVTTYENLLPKNIIEYNILDSSVIEGVYYDLYDDKGNLLQYHTKAGVPTTLIYGYNQSYPIAKIEGISYTDLASILGFSNTNNGYTSLQIVSASNADSNDNYETQTLIPLMDTFRNNPLLKDRLITMYTFDPLVGMTNVIPPSGIKEKYMYDSSNRLEKIIDANGNILKEYKYNYKQ